MLSLFKQCKDCLGPSYLQGTWLEKKYFGDGKAVPIKNELETVNALLFHDIGKQEFRLIRSSEHDIELVLDGTIGGFLTKESKLVLHQVGDFTKICPDNTKSQGASSPTTLKIINSRTTEILAEYSMIWMSD